MDKIVDDILDEVEFCLLLSSFDLDGLIQREYLSFVPFCWALKVLLKVAEHRRYLQHLVIRLFHFHLHLGVEKSTFFFDLADLLSEKGLELVTCL